MTSGVLHTLELTFTQELQDTDVHVAFILATQFTHALLIY